MKTPILFALLAVTAAARAAELPKWTPVAEGWGAWHNVTFTDANNVAHTLRCRASECGGGKTGRAKLYEFIQVGQDPFQMSEGGVFGLGATKWTAYKTTFATKLSNWELDAATRQAVQGDQKVQTQNIPDVTSQGSLIIVRPPARMADDRFTRNPSRRRSSGNPGRSRREQTQRDQRPPSEETSVKPPVAPQDDGLKPLTDAEHARLPAVEREAYEKGIASPDKAVREAAIGRAREWLANHPTKEEFAALDAAAKQRVCVEFWKKETEGNAAAAAPGEGEKKALAQAHTLSAEGKTAAGHEGVSATVDGALNKSASAKSDYQWPPEIRDECQRIIASLNPRQPVGSINTPPPPNSPDLTVKGKGQPLEDDGKKEEPKTAWNPLLNGAKGAVLGAIVGYTLGGPAGMLVGALVMGAAAWGLSKIGDA